ncbi:lytic transglycosylase domain-containing protein [Rhodobacteraceae bacterium HSP-20]|uniref:Lytic transglycosylase domain-containing protein n=1 Tax=Paragemmobacter amnigenus TaxID=2852097 RepID=A0ABS6J6R1_9RHOB|nr:lytic transglycosylase domain-containing protein [Rhodobacter amnigenus]MBU9699242.1 lytic transglycosylase domain-containing protein [Rhodobacter amnigenus]MBV4390469.1 lytic transglycosylase domain-containing protein [Rhodobacter amnigenus]
MRVRSGFGVALALVLVPVVAVAEGLPPERDFSFRRVKVGEALPGRRITVQIDPAEQARMLAALPKAGPASVPVALPPVGPVEDRPQGPVPSAPATYGWFWEAVAPGIAEISGRFPAAMAALSQGPEGAQVVAPRLQDMQRLADRWGTELLKATVGTEVSPALALAVMATESAGREDAESSAGAQGLMQLIPATAERFGVADAMDPVQNIRGGVAYLDWLMKHFDRDPIMVIAAYNAGEGAVRANRGVPPYAETRDYVPKVLAAWQVAQGLCLTPPEVVSDPCVFRVISASN